MEETEDKESEGDRESKVGKESTKGRDTANVVKTDENRNSKSDKEN